MWREIETCMKEHPERLLVAKLLITNGFCVREGKIYCNDVEISAPKIAKVLDVDRRTVRKTIKMIEEDPNLRLIFEKIRPAGHSLRDIAPHLNLGVIEIIPIDARMPGILAKSALLIAERGISIRQAIVDDPELSPEPKLTLITEQKVPGDLIPEFLKIKGIAKVSIY